MHMLSATQALFGLCNLFMRNSTEIQISHQHLWQLQLDTQTLMVAVVGEFKAKRKCVKI